MVKHKKAQVVIDEVVDGLVILTCKAAEIREKKTTKTKRKRMMIRGILICIIREEATSLQSNIIEQMNF